MGAGRLAILVVAGVVSTNPIGALAQVDTTIVRGTCADCEIRLEPLAILGGPRLPFEMGTDSKLAVMSDGRFLVAPTMNNGEIAVFDASGQLERVIGREGEGPGEYAWIRTVLVGPGDTIRVLDRATVTTLAPDFSYVDRAFKQGPTYDAWTIMPTGELVVLATAMEGRVPPQRLHVVGLDGRPSRSFAPAPRTYHGTADLNERIGWLSPSRRYDGLWFGKTNRYALELYIAEQPRIVLVREADWFEPWEGYIRLEGLAVPPRPALQSFSERPDGLLTVVIRRADANWEGNQAGFSRSARPDAPTSNIDRRLIFDSVIEVIDPESGEVVGRLESEDHVRGPVGDGTIVYAARHDVVGRVRIYVHRIVLPNDTP